MTKEDEAMIEQTFQHLFADEFPPDQAIALGDCIDRHGMDLLEQWASPGQKRWNIDTLFRDMTITALVFMTKQKFNFDDKAAARVAAQALSARSIEVTPSRVEKIIKVHKALMRALESTAASEPRNPIMEAPMATEKHTTGLEQLAHGFADAMATHHEADLASGDERIRDAVIVKMVALTALAFGIPPTSDDDVVDVDKMMAKLRVALSMLERAPA
jgi:hypothetical protein